MHLIRTIFLITYIVIVLLAEPPTNRIRYYHCCWQSYLPANTLFYHGFMQHDYIFTVQRDYVFISYRVEVRPFTCVYKKSAYLGINGSLHSNIYLFLFPHLTYKVFILSSSDVPYIFLTNFSHLTPHPHPHPHVGWVFTVFSTLKPYVSNFIWRHHQKSTYMHR